jgi:hypothetical protein
MNDDTPEELRRALASALGSGRPPAPDRRWQDPEEIRRLAESRYASPELKAVAAAVRAGKTTWADAVAGVADDLPEVQAFYTAQRRRVGEIVRSRLVERDRDGDSGFDDGDVRVLEDL